jgi:hypothetical protein
MPEVIMEQQQRHREIAERVYAGFLGEALELPESEWQYLAVLVAQRLLEGATLSLWTGFQMASLVGGRCAHCGALTDDPRTHVCKPEDLQRVKDSALSVVGCGFGRIRGHRHG